MEEETVEIVKNFTKSTETSNLSTKYSQYVQSRGTKNKNRPTPIAVHPKSGSDETYPADLHRASAKPERWSGAK